MTGKHTERLQISCLQVIQLYLQSSRDDIVPAVLPPTRLCTPSSKSCAVGAYSDPIASGAFLLPSRVNSCNYAA